MNYKDLFIGFVLGMIVAFIGAFLFLLVATPYNLISDFKAVIDFGILGKALKLGAILNLAVFFILLKFNKDYVASGIIITFVAITLLAFFI